MKKTASAPDAKDRTMTRAILPIIALGGSLAAAPAASLELGEITVQSNLGRPLRASIAYALAPNEILSNTCVSVQNSTSGLPGIGANTISITEHAIIVTGKESIREPMLGTRVTVNCPQAANLSREYMLFVDPENSTQVSDAIAPVTRTRNVTETANVRPVDIRKEVLEPIGQSSRYQARVGDTLSSIVSRIENRSMKLWPAVDAIFQANPHAFIGSDPNKLKAGSWLDIPSLDGTVPVVAEATPAAVIETPAQNVPAATSNAESSVDTRTYAVYEPSLTAAVPATIEQLPETPADEQLPEAPAEETAVADDADVLRPGDIILERDNIRAETASSITIPTTELAALKAPSTSADVPPAIIATEPSVESSSYLTWLIGAGFAIFAGLFLFVRRARSSRDSTPVDPVITPSAEPAPVEVQKPGTVDELDYDISDESPTEENLTLDVDLGVGTGLGAGTDMEVVEQFGFAETTKPDIELPSETQAEKSSETDIIPPMHFEMESILDSETLPEDDDYDMSVIVDATKMPHPEDVTERDLMAVEVDADDETGISGSYTISKDVDFNILEQDYENELTATQALNEEIERAAAALVDDQNQALNDDQVIDMDIEGGTVNIRAV